MLVVAIEKNYNSILFKFVYDIQVNNIRTITKLASIHVEFTTNSHSLRKVTDWLQVYEISMQIVKWQCTYEI